jgi:hypothetical protein
MPSLCLDGGLKGEVAGKYQRGVCNSCDQQRLLFSASAPPTPQRRQNPDTMAHGTGSLSVVVAGTASIPADADGAEKVDSTTCLSNN